MRKPLREATIALFTSGAIYRDDQDPYYPPGTLITPHIMGRPLGLPHRRDRQLAVILAALHLLETAEHAPTIETFTP